MRRLLKFFIGVSILFSWSAARTLGLDIDTFRDSVYRPKNLPSAPGMGGSEAKIAFYAGYAIDLILYASGSVAVLMLVYGGIRYAVSLGEQDNRDAAKKIIRYSLTGLFAVILSYAAVTNIIKLIYKTTL